MSRREEIIDQIGKIPALPASAIQVVRLLKDPNVDFQELAGSIEYDPGLTSNILRMANSAQYAGAWSVKSVREAIVRLGMNTIFHMVVGSTVAPMVQQPVRGYDLPPGELWHHSVAVSICTGRLASALNIKVPNHAFTAALLHDVGKIVLGTFIEVDTKPIMDIAFNEGISFEVAEQAVLGIDHAETGAILLSNWNIPQCVVDVARWHHQPEHCQEDELVPDLVHIADTLCLIGGIGAGNDGLNYTASDEVAQKLGLTGEVAEKVLCDTIGRLEETSGLFAEAGGRKD